MAEQQERFVISTKYTIATDGSGPNA